MTDAIDALTTRSLSLALDAASLRHQAIAANIANHATPGYVAVKIDFASSMDELRGTLTSGGRASRETLAAMTPTMQPMLDANELPAPIQLDTEMADMARNAVHYQALVKVLAKHMSILSLAAADGKR